MSVETPLRVVEVMERFLSSVSSHCEDELFHPCASRNSLYQCLICEGVVFVLVIVKTHLLLGVDMKGLGKVGRAEGDYQKTFVWVRMSLTTRCPVGLISRTNLSCLEY